VDKARLGSVGVILLALGAVAESFARTEDGVFGFYLLLGLVAAATTAPLGLHRAGAAVVVGAGVLSLAVFDMLTVSGFVAQQSRPDSSAVAGFDLTFSPVKSVSTLWAVAPREMSERIEAAHDAAVTRTLEFLQSEAGYTRVGAHGVAQVNIRGLVAARFTHRDSRAGQQCIGGRDGGAQSAPRQQFGIAGVVHTLAERERRAFPLVHEGQLPHLGCRYQRPGRRRDQRQDDEQRHPSGVGRDLLQCRAGMAEDPKDSRGYAGRA